MKKYIYLTLLIFLMNVLPGTDLIAATRTSSQSGNWSASSTWGGDPPPTAGDDVIINGGFTVTVDIPSIGGIGAEDLVVADFNNDGKLDIASDNLVDFGTYSMSVLYGNGDGTFQSALILPSPQTPDLLNISGITVGDVDNDGDTDIMVANYASHTISFYLNDITTFRYIPIRLGTYYGIYSPFFADFDNDGQGDLVAAGEVPPFGLFSTLLFMKGNKTLPTSISSSLSPPPDQYRLEQNYPNPFNPVTVISFSIAKDQAVTLKIFNAIGEEVRTLINSNLTKGAYKISFDGLGLSSGLYFYRLQSGSQVQVKKMMLLK